jgi:hypothetical protein
MHPRVTGSLTASGLTVGEEMERGKNLIKKDFLITAACTHSLLEVRTP